MTDNQNSIDLSFLDNEGDPENNINIFADENFESISNPNNTDTLDMETSNEKFAKDFVETNLKRKKMVDKKKFVSVLNSASTLVENGISLLKQGVKATTAFNLKDNVYLKETHPDDVLSFISKILPDKKEKAQESSKKEEEKISINELFSTAEELHQEDLEPLTFTVQDFLPSTGAYLLSSKPKTGKTFLALQMASCIASGDKFLKSFDTIKGQVLYVMTQGGRRALKHRIDKVFTNKKELKNLFYLTAIDPLQQGGYETLQNFINLAEKPKLIVLDMITNMFPNIKHSNYQGWAKIFEELNNFALENNISILCVYHSRKEATEGSDFTDDVLGSTGILGSVSGVLTLRRSRDKGEGEIFINHREAESKKKTLIFSDACWSYIGDSLPTRPTDRKVYFLLKEYTEKDEPGLSNKEIAESLDKDRGNITRVLKRMIDDGYIYIHEKRYYLT